jgi:hypothetical protein
MSPSPEPLPQGPAWLALAAALLLQMACAAAMVWVWSAGFGGADAPWGEADSHTASNLLFGISATGLVLNSAAIYLGVTRMPWPLAAAACTAALPACVVASASAYALLIVLGVA